MTTPARSALRSIPSIDRLLADLGETDLPRALVLAVARRELERIRNEHLDATPGNGSAPDVSALQRVRVRLDELRRCRIQPVINATGIIVHTNLGRSPLAPAAADSMNAAALDYSNLEYDLSGGSRGGRGAYVEQALAVLCGAEAATVVNNCAAALLLILRHFTGKPPRTQVVISRGELVQIGGGFRIPEILEAGGAALQEIGTTNITTIDDYRGAVGERTALILRVHHSNFAMTGFVDRPASHELGAVARQAGVPFVEDLGSGATFDTQILGGGEREPTPVDALDAGADLVCFSGDKLLGGPQAGIIAGRVDAVTALKRDPFFRALRCDKLILSALQATVDLLLKDQVDEMPIRAMMRLGEANLRPRAERLIAALNGLPVAAELGTGRGQAGGGALPRTILPSITLDLRPLGGASFPVQRLAERLRLGRPPVVGYIEQDRLKLDLRTVFPRQDESLVEAIRAAVTLEA